MSTKTTNSITIHAVARDHNLTEPQVRDLLNAGRLYSALYPRTCGFCHGLPVKSAAAWADGRPRPPAPCPRCGETNA